MTESVKTSRWATFRAESRIATRVVIKQRRTTVLVAALITLPIMILGALMILSASARPELTSSADLLVGKNQSMISFYGAPNPSRTQSLGNPYNVTEDYFEDTGIINESDPSFEFDGTELPSQLNSFIPPDITPIMFTTAEAFVETEHGFTRARLIVGPAWEPNNDGLFRLISGHAPSNSSEAMISPGAADRLGIAAGDTFTLVDGGTYTVTGILKSANKSDDTIEFFFLQDPDVPEAVSFAHENSFYFADWQPSDAEIKELNQAGYTVFVRDYLLNSPDGQKITDTSAIAYETVLLIAGLIFSAYIIVLLAGAAISVSARRQQHALAVVSSVGATRTSILRIILAQGAAFGLLGGLVGVGIGIGLAYIAQSVLNNGDETFFPAIQFPVLVLLGVIIFAVISGLLAALFPALSASRGDVLVALRGSRLPAKLDARAPLFGLVLILLGLFASIASAICLASIYLMALSDPDAIVNLELVQTLSFIIILGPIVFQIGVIISGHWVLKILSRMLSKLGLAPRIASRDSVATPGRIVPAFGAIAATVFIGVFAVATVSMSTAATEKNFAYSAPPGSAEISVWSEDGSEVPEGVVKKTELLLSSIGSTQTLQIASLRPEHDDYHYSLRDHNEPCTEQDLRSAIPCSDEWAAATGVGSVSVVAVEDISGLVGVNISKADLDSYRTGTAIVLEPIGGMPKWQLVENEQIEILLNDNGGGLNYEAGVGFTDLNGNSIPTPEPVSMMMFPAIEIKPAFPVWYNVLISPETATAKGLDYQTDTFIGLGPLTNDPALLDNFNAAGQSLWAGEPRFGSSWAYLTEGPYSATGWLWGIVAAVAVLVLGAGAVTLGLARVERRRDDATLSAIGAAPMLRRNIAFWQGLTIIGLGSITGTIAGLVAAWGISILNPQSSLADVSWFPLVTIAFGLPLLTAIINWLIPPQNTELSRRNNFG